jgi:hypothetical protein
MMKNVLVSVWYRVTFVVVENGNCREHTTFVEGSSEIGAAVSAAVSICNGRSGISSPTLKSIRIATYGETDSLNAELDAIAGREAKELEKEDNE